MADIVINFGSSFQAIRPSLAPDITFNDDGGNISLNTGADFVDPGGTVGGKGNYTVDTSELNMAVPGEYKVKYIIVDLVGRKRVVERTIIVGSGAPGNEQDNVGSTGDIEIVFENAFGYDQAVLNKLTGTQVMLQTMANNFSSGTTTVLAPDGNIYGFDPLFTSAGAVPSSTLLAAGQSFEEGEAYSLEFVRDLTTVPALTSPYNTDPNILSRLNTRSDYNPTGSDHAGPGFVYLESDGASFTLSPDGPSNFFPFIPIGGTHVIAFDKLLTGQNANNPIIVTRNDSGTTGFDFDTRTLTINGNDSPADIIKALSDAYNSRYLGGHIADGNGDGVIDSNDGYFGDDMRFSILQIGASEPLILDSDTGVASTNFLQTATGYTFGANGEITDVAGLRLPKLSDTTTYSVVTDYTGLTIPGLNDTLASDTTTGGDDVAPVWIVSNETGDPVSVNLAKLAAGTATGELTADFTSELKGGDGLASYGVIEPMIGLSGDLSISLQLTKPLWWDDSSGTIVDSYDGAAGHVAITTPKIKATTGTGPIFKVTVNDQGEIIFEINTNATKQQLLQAMASAFDNQNPQAWGFMVVDDTTGDPVITEYTGGTLTTLNSLNTSLGTINEELFGNNLNTDGTVKLFSGVNSGLESVGFKPVTNLATIDTLESSLLSVETTNGNYTSNEFDGNGTRRLLNYHKMTGGGSGDTGESGSVNDSVSTPIISISDDHFIVFIDNSPDSATVFNMTTNLALTEGVDFVSVVDFDPNNPGEADTEKLVIDPSLPGGYQHFDLPAISTDGILYGELKANQDNYINLQTQFVGAVNTGSESDRLALTPAENDAFVQDDGSVWMYQASVWFETADQGQLAGWNLDSNLDVQAITAGSKYSNLEITFGSGSVNMVDVVEPDGVGGPGTIDVSINQTDNIIDIIQELQSSLPSDIQMCILEMEDTAAGDGGGSGDSAGLAGENPYSYEGETLQQVQVVNETINDADYQSINTGWDSLESNLFQSKSGDSGSYGPHWTLTPITDATTIVNADQAYSSSAGDSIGLARNLINLASGIDFLNDSWRADVVFDLGNDNNDNIMVGYNQNALGGGFIYFSEISNGESNIEWVNNYNTGGDSELHFNINTSTITPGKLIKMIDDFYRSDNNQVYAGSPKAVTYYLYNAAMGSGSGSGSGSGGYGSGSGS